ncbi:MAG: hypothetical protein AAGH42_11655 [Pseudomonadota bacterium]
MSCKNTLIYSGLVLLCSVLFSLQPAAAQDTILTVGVPDDNFSRFTPQRVDGLTIRASEVDALIANKRNTANALLGGFGLDQRIGTFPRNFVRDELNDLFGDLDELERDLESSIRRALPMASQVRRVRFVDLGRDEVKIQVRHLGTAFSAGAMGFNGRVRVEVNQGIPVFCPSPDVTIGMANVGAMSTYNVFTGALMDTMIDYRLTEADVDCGNPFGDLLLAVASIFVSIEDIFNNLIDDEIQNIEGMLDMQELFSIRNFFESLKTAIDVSGPAFVNEDKVDMAIDAALEFFGSGRLQSGLQIDFNVFDSNSFSQPNRITLAASHQTPRISEIAQNGSQLVIFVNKPPRTGRVTLFQSGSQQIASTTGNFFRIRAPRAGTRLQVTGESTLINGLRSFPSPFSSQVVSPGPCFNARQCSPREGR